MSLSDTFYVALCMTILILGVVYWFWTQNQYIQRKLNLLENIVYEMKTTLNAQASAPDMVDAVLAANSSSGNGPDLVSSEGNYPPPPGSELGEDEDLLHQELSSEIQAETLAPMPENDHEEKNIVAEEIADDLQPGGVGSGVHDVETDNSAKQDVLDGMTRAQLKRLAEQKGVSVKPTMSKQALIEAIRAVPVTSLFDNHEATISLN
jgi:hypothetical protein